MENEVWDKVINFLNQLRGEQRSRSSSVQLQGVSETEKKEELLHKECSGYMEKLSHKEQQKIEEWQEKLEELSHLREQQAYCQGYVDCIYLLSGLGLLKQDAQLDNFIEKVNE